MGRFDLNTITLVWQIVPIGIVTVILGAWLAWARVKRNLNRTVTIQMYQHFYSSDFAKTRTEARYFVLFFRRHGKKSCEYFIYVKIHFPSVEERDEYYSTITSFANILYFFSGLYEYHRLGAIDRTNLKRFFSHVFEWWYLAVIRDFLEAYEDCYFEAKNDPADRDRLQSKPPWAYNLQALAKLFKLK